MNGPEALKTFMAKLEFDIEWIEPETTEIPEYRATWAALRVYIGDQCVTRFYDEQVNSVRKTLILPVYPLAEWIAVNWWSLLYESVTPGRTDADDYAYRHNLRYARNGYALPEVLFTPAGDTIQIQWSASELGHYGVEFLDSGETWVPRPTFVEELTRLLDTVAQRLEDHDVHDTPLQDEWSAINQADVDEQAFCRAAAQLGFYPYDVPEHQETAILDIADSIPRELYPTFFGAASPDRLPEQADRLIEGIRVLQDLDGRVDQLLDLRNEVAPYHSRYAPWEEGYEFARRLRSILDVEEATFPTTADVAQTFYLAGNGSEDSIQEFESHHLFDALVVNSERGGPGFALDKHRDDAKKFALCRGMFEYLNSSNGHPLLVTRERTERQKRNRAFAAEFLAPSSMLSQSVADRTVDEEDLDNLAETFGVSSLVIQHQLQNHQIVDEVVA